MYKLVFTLLAALTTSVSVSAAPILFAITGPNSVAEKLAYGTNSITESDSPYLSTVNGNTQHSSWYQNFTSDGSNSLFTITWNFGSEKTLAQRFGDAVNTGEAVTWTINNGGVKTQVSGIWRFSSTAGDLAAKFDGSSGSGFSDGDGFWGAGTYVDGEYSNRNNILFGVGNLDNRDTATCFEGNAGQCLIIDGERFASQDLVDHRNYMYLNAPSAVPVPAAVWLFGSAVLGLLAVARRKKV